MILEMRGRHCLRNASTADGQGLVAVATSKTALVKPMVLQEKVFTVGLS